MNKKCESIFYAHKKKKMKMLIREIDSKTTMTLGMPDSARNAKK